MVAELEKDVVKMKHSDEEDRKLIQNSYRRLLKSFKKVLSEADMNLLRGAYEMAVEAHAEQRRKTGEPYITHPIAVAQICVQEIGLGPTAAAAALLHDVVEDTDVSLADIKKRFGEHIALMVDGLTKLDKTLEADSPQAENFKKVLTTITIDVRIVLIKMADRLHNMRTIESMPLHKQVRIAAETAYIYTPLAHRLGLYNIKTEFEALCMRITDKETYEEVESKIAATEKDRQAYIEKFCDPIRRELDEMKVPYRISGRPKSVYSIANKMKKKNIPFEEIYDLFAVRIIFDPEGRKERHLCWNAFSIVTDIYTSVPERLKDWVTMPKANGYESLHATVIGPNGRFVEVQIRTERMNDIAERGFAAHWKYKGIGKQSDVYESFLKNVREQVENPTNALEFMEDFKTNLFQEEVYVFSPKGDMQLLPKGATGLDFAFHIHSDLGYHCTAVRVNSELVPMGTKLKNGDLVEIVTNNRQKPTESWLKLVVTGKARSKIRAALKEFERKQGELGKEALVRKLKSLKADFDTNVDMLVKHFGFKTRTELFFNIANEQIDLMHDLKVFKVEHGKLIVPAPATPAAPATPIPETKPQPAVVQRGKPKLYINGEPGDFYEYSLATCCNPVLGDEIFAYLALGQGFKIHRTTCTNAANLAAKHGSKMLSAEWSFLGDTTFIAELLIRGVDGPGVIERLSSHITKDLGLDIRSFFIEAHQGFYEGKVRIVVNNKDQLNKVIQALKKVESVSNVQRIL